MKVSVVICAYTIERWSSLEAAVQSCTTQSQPPDEVIVVIDYNEELRSRAVDELVGCVVVANQSKKGLSGARNTGVALSTGDTVVFLDDDAFAEPGWLEHLIAPLSDPKVAGVGGWILPFWEGAFPRWFPETFFWVLGCSYAGLAQDGDSIRNPIGASMAIRRNVFTTVGGFTDGLGRIGRNPLGCEETELCIRYIAQAPNERFVMARQAVVHHRVPKDRLSWRYFRARCWSEGLSKAAVSTLVGSGAGLAAERRHVARSIPRELGKSLRQFPSQPRDSFIRSALIIVGTTCAAAGLVRGRIALRRSPPPFDAGQVDALTNTRGEGGAGTSLL